MVKKAPRRFGKYELIAKVAHGGMAALYKVRHPTLDRVVLLKKLALRSAGDPLVERFRREARLMMDLKSDRIVQVHDHFKEGNEYFIVEEYVDGMSLQALLKRDHALSLGTALLIVLEVARALAYAHEKRVVHRDIKPGNILLSRGGEIKIVDFGIAAARGLPDDGLTRAGTLLGTPAYMAPEQIADARSVDHRADIYSLGVVLYEMLTGQTPFGGSFTADTLRAIHKGKYLPARRLNPSASPALCRIARRCMKVRARRRYQDLAALLRVLERLARRRDPSALREAVRNAVEGKDVGDLFVPRRAPVLQIAGGALLAVLLAAGGFLVRSTGLWYEYVQPGSYGALVVAVKGSNPAGPEGPRIRAALYEENADSLRPLPGLDLAFRPHLSPAPDPGGVPVESLVQSRTVYLPAGRYRLKLDTAGGLFWRSFTLGSITAARARHPRNPDDVVLIDTGTGLPARAQLQVSLFDTVTGAAIHGPWQVSLSSGNEWIPWAAADQEITSAGTWLARIECPGYRPQEFTLDLQRYQSMARIEAGMEPLALVHPQKK